jgi:hypothetical protein
MTRRTLLRLTSSGVKFNCFIIAETLLIVGNHQRKNEQLGVGLP